MRCQMGSQPKTSERKGRQVTRCASPECNNPLEPGPPRKIFCSKRCKGRTYYLARRAELLRLLRSHHPADQVLAYVISKANSERVRKYYHEKKGGTWVRKRAPGAGRPKKEK